MRGAFINFNEVLIPETFVPVGHHADRLALLADELAYRTNSQKDYQNGRWISFPRACWRRISSQSYSDVKEDAVLQGLIELNESYSSSKKNWLQRPFPKSLRLTEQHRKSALKQYRLLRAARREPAANIVIDQDDTVGRWLALKLSTVSVKTDLNLTALETYCKTEAARNCLRASLMRLRQGRLHAKRCEYGRFHSNFTNMKKELRQKLTFCGDELVQIDIVNSQPALLPYVTQGHIRRREGAGGKDEGLIDREVSRFIDSLGISSGNFYERAAVALSLPPQDRDKIKLLFFESLYGTVETTRKSKLFQLIRKVSPVVGNAILAIKTPNHRTLAHQLQLVESDIVIERCCGQLMKAEPSMPLITVHDELMTTAEYSELAATKLQSAFLEVCGYPCSVTTSAANPVFA